MPAFGNYGKSGKPVPKCPYHNKSLATCTCKYAVDWRDIKPHLCVACGLRNRVTEVYIDT